MPGYISVSQNPPSVRTMVPYTFEDWKSSCDDAQPRRARIDDLIIAHAMVEMSFRIVDRRPELKE
ncbi:hypothetical protein E4U41_002626 [Claviceps citrina]|nr:hypothetical protein E4U41_002626 [Claviceps citrina]